MTVSVCFGMTVPPPEYAHARSLRRQRERSQPRFRQLQQRTRFVDRRWARTHHELVIGSSALADGARSAAHWLADRLDVEACTVRDWIRVGRALRGPHASAVAYESGELSYGKIRALVSVATVSSVFASRVSR